jgi:hypothetical protein
MGNKLAATLLATRRLQHFGVEETHHLHGLEEKGGPFLEDLLTIRLARADNLVELDRAGYFLQLQVHDETDGSYGSVAEAKAAGNIMRTSILEVCEPLVPFKVDTECGPSWGEIKSV